MRNEILFEKILNRMGEVNAFDIRYQLIFSWCLT